MDSKRKTPTGGNCRPGRRRSSRPAGAPTPAAERTPAPVVVHTSTLVTPQPTVSPLAPRPARPTKTPRNGAIVLDPHGVAGKAPKRYTRSAAQNKGRRPVTRSLTKSQVKRSHGRYYPETSAGGLVLRNMRRAYNPRTNRVYLSTVKVALIGRTDRRGRLLWSLPKGHIEDYETVPMTAIREVREETGIEGEIIKRLGTIDYWFLSDGKRIHKTVHHYLLRFTGGELSNADAEITEVKWVPLKDLPRVLSYADERKLARRAIGTVSAWIRHEYGTGGTVVTVGKDTSEKNTSGKERKNRDQNQNQNRNPKNRSQAGQKQAEQKQAGQPYKGHKDQQQKSQPQKDRRNQPQKGQTQRTQSRKDQPRKDQSQKEQVQKEQTRQGQARRRRRRRGHRGRGRNGNSAPSS